MESLPSNEVSARPDEALHESDHTMAPAAMPGTDPQCAIKLLLSNTIVSVIIGERGRAIRALNEITHASIKISAANVLYPGTSDRIVLISGLESQVLCAIKFLLSLVTLSRKVDGSSASSKRSACSWDPLTVDPAVLIDYSYVVLRVTVPTAAGGLLLGRNGKTLRAISAVGGARLHISSQEESEVWSERILTIAGPALACLHSTELVLRKLAELNPRLLARFSDKYAVNQIHNYTYRGCFGKSVREFDGIYVDATLNDDGRDVEKDSEGGASTGTGPEEERAPSTATSCSATTQETRLTSSSDFSSRRIPDVVGIDDARSEPGSQLFHIGHGNSATRGSSASPGPSVDSSNIINYSCYSSFQHPRHSSKKSASLGSPKSPKSTYVMPRLDAPLVPFTIPYPPILQTAAALDQQLESIAEMSWPSSETITIVMSIPDELIGTVFGKLGASLRLIKLTSQADICVSSRGEFDFGTMNRRVHITGPPANARAAMLLIHAKVQAAALLLMPMGYIYDPWTGVGTGSRAGRSLEYTRGDSSLSRGDDSLGDATEGEEDELEDEAAAAGGSSKAKREAKREAKEAQGCGGPNVLASTGPVNLSFTVKDTSS